MFAYFVFLFGIRVRKFDPAVYRRTVVENSDFRKYDDILRMTLDCTSGPRRPHRGAPRRGGARERRALRHCTASRRRIMTCIVPSIADNDHLHFVDGAAGGYAMAARQLKLHAEPVSQ